MTTHEPLHFTDREAVEGALCLVAAGWLPSPAAPYLSNSGCILQQWPRAWPKAWAHSLYTANDADLRDGGHRLWDLLVEMHNALPEETT